MTDKEGRFSFGLSAVFGPAAVRVCVLTPSDTPPQPRHPPWRHPVSPIEEVDRRIRIILIVSIVNSSVVARGNRHHGSCGFPLRSLSLEGPKCHVGVCQQYYLLHGGRTAAAPAPSSAPGATSDVTDGIRSDGGVSGRTPSPEAAFHNPAGALLVRRGVQE